MANKAFEVFGFFKKLLADIGGGYHAEVVAVVNLDGSALGGSSSAGTPLPVATVGNITAVNGVLARDVSAYGNVVISMATTALAGHSAAFEASNNSTNGTDGTWYQLSAVRSNSAIVEVSTGVLAATPAYAWELSVNAWRWVRVKATAHTSGTAAYTIQPTAEATEPNPVVTHSGNIGANQGTAAAIGTAGAGAWPVRSAAHQVTDIASVALTTNNTSGAIDVSGNVGAHQIFTDVTVVSGTNPRLITRLQGSPDATGANWLNIFDAGVMTSAAAANKLAGATPLLPIEFHRLRYVRMLAGTTPSFTHSVVRSVRPGVEGIRQRRLVDAVLSLVAAAGTPSSEHLYVGGCTRAMVHCTPLTGATTAPSVKLQQCFGDPAVAANWSDVPGSTLALNASTTMASAELPLAAPALFVRLVMVVAGVAVVANTYQLSVLSWEA